MNPTKIKRLIGAAAVALMLGTIGVAVAPSAASSASNTGKVWSGKVMPTAPWGPGSGRAALPTTPSATVPSNTYTFLGWPHSYVTGRGVNINPTTIAFNGYNPIFWANQGTWASAPTAAAFYVGLSSEGVNGATGSDSVTFSVFDWNSAEYSGTGCQGYATNFDGSGNPGIPGTECQSSYTIDTTHTYTIDINYVGQDSNGLRWQAQIIDDTTSTSTIIGTISTPSSWSLISGTNGTNVLFSEWFGGPRACLTGTDAQATWSSYFDGYYGGGGSAENPNAFTDQVQQGTGCETHSSVGTYGTARIHTIGVP